MYYHPHLQFIYKDMFVLGKILVWLQIHFRIYLYNYVKSNLFV